jgi:ABC-type dipeptide/oligopeptide/nickel transport system ATPase subunit
MNDQILVDCRNVNVHFGAHHVLKHVNLTIRPGETVGLVGESGSGKTTLGRAILGIGPVSSGEIVFDGENIAGVPPRARQGQAAIQAVFQDPYSSLNPSMMIEDILTEPIVARGLASRADASRQVRKLLDQVALPSDAAERFAREFSGGQRQRIAIARALAMSRSPPSIFPPNRGSWTCSSRSRIGRASPISSFPTIWRRCVTSRIVLR